MCQCMCICACNPAFLELEAYRRMILIPGNLSERKGAYLIIHINRRLLELKCETVYVDGELASGMECLNDHGKKENEPTTRVLKHYEMREGQGRRGRRRRKF